MHTFSIQILGETPLTGTATLELTLTDINDNAPTFAENYRPIIPEEEKVDNREVVEILAQDPDTRQYGPPFGFAFSNDCPQALCGDLFSLQYNSGRLMLGYLFLGNCMRKLERIMYFSLLYGAVLGSGLTKNATPLAHCLISHTLLNCAQTTPCCCRTTEPEPAS